MIFYYAEGGALVCDEPIPEVTSNMAAHQTWDSSWYGGHQFFVAESMNKETARRMAHALGGVLCESIIPPARQLIATTVDIRREISRHAMYGEHARGKD